ncbi:hypothetical protein HYH03_002890 [Edaphochlamys debaryana]|uniref:Fe2OG dioxygenase domain-containing protein n=1 Tax=Edaphochlamys debaryana TaxID=47281 RepID=A0A835YCY6_9CHLO|nr:hypothetical protein HYH03_002890 [Edaphochlamys debaryana]|eukprot:KAG2499312.1 hypothetical protein HYH03_002890 [Edaphochlamys debaryana]
MLARAIPSRLAQPNRWARPALAARGLVASLRGGKAPEQPSTRHVAAKASAAPREASRAEQSLDAKLGEVAAASPFFVAGSQQLQRSLHLTLIDKGSSSSSGAQARVLTIGKDGIAKADLEALLQAAEPAPFGRDSELVLDPSYRKVLQIKAGAFGLDTVLPTPEMLTDIASLMQPSAPQIFAQLHKINIHGPGGMFKAHADTPSGNTQFGSLVVTLPSAFEGGELLVQHAGQTATLPLGGGGAAAAADQAPAGPEQAQAGPDQPPAGPVLHFAAFFSDCIHEVLPVTSGHRVTLTYNLLAVSAAKQGGDEGAAPLLSTVRPLAGGGLPLVSQLRTLLGDASWHPEGTTMGYVLQHKYATSLKELNDRMFPGVLKGGDRLLYAELSQGLGLKVRVVPIHQNPDGDSDMHWDWEVDRIRDNMRDEDEDEEGEEGEEDADVEDSAFFQEARAKFEAERELVTDWFVGRDFAYDAEALDDLYETRGSDAWRELAPSCFKPAKEVAGVWVGLSERAEEQAMVRSQMRMFGNEPTGETVYTNVALLPNRWARPALAARGLVASLRGGKAPEQPSTRHVAAKASAAPREASRAEQSLDAKLGQAAAAAPFFVAGSQQFQRPLSLILHSSGGPSGAGARVLNIGKDGIAKADLEALLQAAEPAPFGRDSELVLDPSYRKALQIKAGAFGLDTVLPTPEMLADIASLMQPSAPQIFAQLHKINIYGPGGMFKAHADTPSGNTQFGSLVVTLPSAFEGGELLVQHAGQTAALPLGGGGAATEGAAPAGPEQAPAGPVVHFAAFFSDCIHEVLPVTSGHRVTLTYNLLAVGAAQQGGDEGSAPLLSTVRPLAGGGLPLVSQLRTLLGDASWHPEGTTMGYVLQHKYATSLRELNDRMFPGVLKGGDRLLYAELSQGLGLKVGVVPIHQNLAGDNWMTWDEEYEKEKEESGDYFQTHEEFLEDIARYKGWFVGLNFDADSKFLGSYFDGSEDGGWPEWVGGSRMRPAKEAAPVWVGLTPTATLPSSVTIRPGQENAQEALFKQMQQEDEHVKKNLPKSAMDSGRMRMMGNEPSFETVYSSVAFLVDLPAWGTPERERARGADRAPEQPSTRHVAAKASATPREAPRAEQGLDAKLGDVAAASPFFVAGSQQLQRAIQVVLIHKGRSASGGAQARVLTIGKHGVSKDDLEALLQAAEPAPFGRDSELVIDPSYRKALQIKAGAFVLDTILPTPEMLADIASLMQPSAPQIFAQLHKINIYGPGSMFKAHADTPSGNSQFGSLVVTLPSVFEGGELLVQHTGQTATLPLGGGGAPAADQAPAGPEQAPAGPVVHFAAFFSDCIHEVLPVTSGHRVTLTYNLMAVGAAKQSGGHGSAPLLSTVRPLAGGGLPLVSQLRTLLGDASWHPEGTTMGYVLQHKYATSLRELNDRMFPGVLKGGDRLLYAELSQGLGLKVRVVPIHQNLSGDGKLHWSEWDEKWNEEHGEPVRTHEDFLADVARFKGWFVGHSFDADRCFLESYFDGRDDGGWPHWVGGSGAVMMRPAKDVASVWVGLTPTLTRPSSVSYRDGWESAMVEVEENRKERKEVVKSLPKSAMAINQRRWMGNEPSFETVYSSVAYLVKLPAWGTPERERARGA